MKARMTNPILLVPDAMQAAMALANSTKKGDVPAKTLDLVHLRASQINGCSLCVDMHARTFRQHGETDERLFTVAAWRDAPYFTDAERAALALTEAATRLSDRSDPVPDEIWEEAAKHYDEPQLAILVLSIATSNFWNRLNITTRQVAGEWVNSAEGKAWLKEHAAAQNENAVAG
jgi:AhpD family alkylhydroperoxidase